MTDTTMINILAKAIGETKMPDGDSLASLIYGSELAPGDAQQARAATDAICRDIADQVMIALAGMRSLVPPKTDSTDVHPEAYGLLKQASGDLALHTLSDDGKPYSFIDNHAAYAAVTAALKARDAWKTEVDRCHRRLEIDRVWRASGGQERAEVVDVPLEDRREIPDGIECRDETIKLQRAEVVHLRRQRDALVRRLERITGRKVDPRWLAGEPETDRDMWYGEAPLIADDQPFGADRFTLTGLDERYPRALHILGKHATGHYDDGRLYSTVQTSEAIYAIEEALALGDAKERCSQEQTKPDSAWPGNAWVPPKLVDLNAEPGPGELIRVSPAPSLTIRWYWAAATGALAFAAGMVCGDLHGGLTAVGHCVDLIAQMRTVRP